MPDRRNWMFILSLTAWVAIVTVPGGWGGALGRFGPPWDNGPLPALVCALLAAAVSFPLLVAIEAWGRREP